jgi:uncharacterized protein (DUF608 family)
MYLIISCRRYARYFGDDGRAAPKLAYYALNTFTVWEQKIDDWQSPVLQNRYVTPWSARLFTINSSSIDMCLLNGYSWFFFSVLAIQI